MEKPAAGSRGIGQVTFSPDGKRLVAACGGRGWPDFTGEDSMLAVWDVPTWELAASFVASQYNVNDLEISPDGSLIAASCHREKTVKLWRMPAAKERKKASPEEIETLIEELVSDDFVKRKEAQEQLQQLGDVARKPLERALKEGSPEQQFRAEIILKALVGGDTAPLHVIRARSDQQSVAFSPDGTILATGSSTPGKQSVVLYCLGAELERIEVPTTKGAWDIAFRPDGKQLALGSKDGTVSLMKVEALLGQ